MKLLHNVKLAIAEDHQFYREGLIARLKQESGIAIVGQFENGRVLLDFLKTNAVEVVLMDITMPVMNGVEATRYLTENYPAVKVIALTMFDDDNSIIEMLEAGAQGYLLKNTEFNEMLTVIEDVLAGKSAYCQSITAKVIGLLSKYRTRTLKKPANELTAIEFSILKLLCQSYSAKEIGVALHLSERTVEGYKGKIAQKFDVKSTVAMVIYALKNKLIDIKDLRT